MGLHPAIEREELACLLADLPPGRHIGFVSPALPPGTLPLLREAADEEGELLLLHGVSSDTAVAHGAAVLPQFQPATWAPMLQELRASAQGAGFHGLLVAVQPEVSAAALGADGHADAEVRLGPEVTNGVRVVCLYTGRARRLLGREEPRAVEGHWLHYGAREVGA